MASEGAGVSAEVRALYATEPEGFIARFIERHDIVSLPQSQGVVVGRTPDFYRWSFASMWTPGPFETKPSRAYYYLTDVDRAWAPMHHALAPASDLGASTHLEQLTGRQPQLLRIAEHRPGQQHGHHDDNGERGKYPVLEHDLLQIS